MVNIIPGEPVPPGFEDEVQRIPVIQRNVESFQAAALIGIEYTIELHEENRLEPEYFCVLCSKSSNSRRTFGHWTSFNHRLKYIEKHYPSAIQICNNELDDEIMTRILDRLSTEIEKHYGRLILYTATADEFRRSRNKIIDEINAKYHFDENVGPKFVDIVEETLAESKLGLKSNFQHATGGNAFGLDEISSESDNDNLKKTESGQPEKKKRKLEQQPAYNIRRSPRSQEKRSSSMDRKQPTIMLTSIKGVNGEKKLPTPKELSVQASHITQERYKWEKFNCMVEIQKKHMRKQKDEYDKNPEKHPEYPAEWKKFWNRRYKELQAEKKVDPNKYDYKPEWITYWKVRMVELFDMAIEKKKKEIKVKLGFREDDVEKVGQLKEQYKVNVKTSSKSMQRQRNIRYSMDQHSRSNSINDVINISDDESKRSDTCRRGSGHRSRTRSRTPLRRSRSPRLRISRDRDRSPAFSMSPVPVRRDHRRRAYRTSRSRSRSPHYERDLERRHNNVSPIHREARVGRSRGDFRSNEHKSDRIDFGYGSSSIYGTRSSHVFTSSDTGEHFRVMDSRDYPEYHRPDRSLTPTSLVGMPTSKSASLVKETSADSPEVDEGPLTIVGVLRMLAALEEHLGSLGPKILDLLGKALAMEKVKANAAEDLLLNEDYCVFLETVKEKLKGLLITDVLDEPQKIRVVKKVITNIAAIIHQVNSKGSTINNDSKKSSSYSNTETKDAELLQSKQLNNTSVRHSSLPFGRQLVVSRLAALLVARGCETITTSDMDKLLHFFVLLASINRAKWQSDGQRLVLKDVFRAIGVLSSSRKLLAYTQSGSFLGDELEKELTDLVNDVEDSSKATDGSDDKGTAGNVRGAGSGTGAGDANNLGSLTDAELKLLLKNFKFLSDEEQDHLISHLKKLEKNEPTRVENLRKYVNVAELTEDIGACGDILGKLTHRHIGDGLRGNGGGANRVGSAGGGSGAHDGERPSVSSLDFGRSERSTSATFNLCDDVDANVEKDCKVSLDDDDDDDYNFDEVFQNRNLMPKSRSKSPLQNDTERPTTSKAAAAATITEATSALTSAGSNRQLPNVSGESTLAPLNFKPTAELKISLNDTENLIANLMGSLQQNAASVSAKLNQISGQQMTADAPSKQQQQPHQQQHQQQLQQQHQMMMSDQRQRNQEMQQQQNQQQKHQQQQHQQQQQQPTHNMPYYQQQQQQQPQQYPGMGAAGSQVNYGVDGYQQQQQQHPPAVHYNPLYGYGNAYSGFMGGPQQTMVPAAWPQNNPYFMPPQQQQQQQQQQPPQQYNMFGGRAPT